MLAASAIRQPCSSQILYLSNSTKMRRQCCLPAMKPFAAACQCLVSARWFAECCGRRNKPDPSGLSSSPTQWEGAAASPRWSTGCCGQRSTDDRIGRTASPSLEEEAPQQAQVRPQVQEVHHHWLHHLQVDPHLLCHWSGSALCSLIWGAR